MGRSDHFPRLRVVFFGTPVFAVPTLEALAKAGFEIPLVVTQPDRPKGRRRVPTPPPVKVKALESGFPILQPQNPNADEFISKIEVVSPDVIVTVAYGHLLKKKVLSLPPFGCVNLHASLLPRYRGAAPVAWAILRGEKVTGVTVMLMDEGMDTGPILRKAEVPILPDDTTETLSFRLAKIGADILPGAIIDYTSGNLRAAPQDEREATDAPPLKKQDGGIDWRETADEIERHIRAMIPWPGAFTTMENLTLKIFRAAVADEPLSLPAGHGVITGDKWFVATGKGTLNLLEIQMGGKKRMDIVDFLKGFKKRGEVVFDTQNPPFPS